jgi:hypothetical protein
MGCLGPPEVAETTWQGALTTMKAGLQQSREIARTS